MSEPMTADEAREAADKIDQTADRTRHLADPIAATLRAYADMLDQQAPDDVREAVKRLLMDYADRHLDAQDDPDPNEYTDLILALFQPKAGRE